MKFESRILSYFFDLLNSKKATYCVMNNYLTLPEIIPSDVDIAIDEKTFSELDSMVLELALEFDVVITQKIWHGYNKCAYILSPLNPKRYFWLQLDFFVDFCGKGYPNLLPVNKMLQGRKRYKNFFIPAPEIEVPFVIQRRIFKGDIEKKHIDIVNKLYVGNEVDVKKGIIDCFGENTGNILIEIIEDLDIRKFHSNFTEFRKQLRRISNGNTPLFYRAKYTFWQVIRAVYRLYYPTGLSIKFISTSNYYSDQIIDSIYKRISGSFHGVTYFVVKKDIKYFKFLITRALWSKASKQCVIMKSEPDSAVVRFFGSLFTSKLCGANIVIKLPADLKNVDDAFKEKIVDDSVLLILTEQKNRTMKHFKNIFSPTGRS